MSKALDRLGLLSTFARIAERGSISAAARDLGLSQASASRQLKALEEGLGVQLVQRTTHSLSLSQAGQDCLAEARVLIEGWDALAERFAGEESQVRGKLKVVAPVALGQLHLAEAVLRFQQAQPGVSITWLLEDETIRFAEIGCDLWIKVGPVPDETLVVRSLGRVERLVVAAPDLIKGRRISAPADLAELPCAALAPFEAASIPLTRADGTVETVDASVALATNNIFAAHKAAQLGIGYAVMPRWFVEGELKAGDLIDVLPGWRAKPLTINAAYLPSRRQTRRLKLLIDHMAEAVSAIPGIDGI
ncbi:LysR family transcriptional regulator [Pelagibius litoralis]|uniref:LysR family transcriptional regulator n=1 Tax=Pelagibius litoralis TaxID=374515 RepID=A0A967EZZ2_9PROT|nr:LysR family transcriptional regulator [Pelagibius litoralis]NIA70556.1 LysR family transcriptional regulator [Pelagibius litoralis]